MMQNFEYQDNVSARMQHHNAAPQGNTILYEQRKLSMGAADFQWSVNWKPSDRWETNLAKLIGLMSSSLHDMP
jgi:hypothetical protein